VGAASALAVEFRDVHAFTADWCCRAITLTMRCALRDAPNGGTFYMRLENGLLVNRDRHVV
jgi:hypothetical protein